SRAFPDLDAIVAASEAELTAIDGVGPTIAQSLQRWFAIDRNTRLVKRLREAGVNFTGDPAPVVATKDATLADLTFVLTGTLEQVLAEVRVARDQVLRNAAAVDRELSGELRMDLRADHVLRQRELALLGKHLADRSRTLHGRGTVLLLRRAVNRGRDDEDQDAGDDGNTARVLRPSERHDGEPTGVSGLAEQRQLALAHAREC